MNTRNVALFVAGLVIGIVAVWIALAAQPTLAGLTGAYCLAPRCYCLNNGFEVGIYAGPDAGFQVKGKILYSVNADGSFGVQVKADNGELITGSGQAVGRSMDMVLVRSNGDHIYAHGTQDVADLRECKGGTVGPATGPRYGDIGDWGSRYPPYIRIISPYLGLN
jgi:hypothetical protein